MNRNQAKPIGYVLKKLSLTIVILLYLQSVYSQEKVIKRSGDALLFAFPAVALGTTFIKNDTQGTWQFTKGFLLNLTITAGVKYTISKERPDGSNDNSFPSGHTSITFQSATFLQRRYGWKYGIPAYILASYTGFSRIFIKKHDLIDCLVGAAFGIGSSYIFTTPYQQEHMELTFNTTDGNYLLGFRYKF